MMSGMNPSTGRAVRITITGGCGHVLWQGYNSMEEKYPLYCEQCDATYNWGAYPFTVSIKIIWAIDAPAEELA